VRFNKEDAGHNLRGSIRFCIVRRPRQLRRAAQRARGEYGYGRRQTSNEGQPGTAARRGHLTLVGRTYLQYTPSGNFGRSAQ